METDNTINIIGRQCEVVPFTRTRYFKQVLTCNNKTHLLATKKHNNHKWVGNIIRLAGLEDKIVNP